MRRFVAVSCFSVAVFFPASVAGAQAADTPAVPSVSTPPNALLPTDVAPVDPNAAPDPLAGVGNEAEAPPEIYPPVSVKAPRLLRAISSELDEAKTQAYAVQAQSIMLGSAARGLLAQQHKIDADKIALAVRVEEARVFVVGRAVDWYTGKIHAESQQNLGVKSFTTTIFLEDAYNHASDTAAQLKLSQLEESQRSLDDLSQRLALTSSASRVNAINTHLRADGLVNKVVALRAEQAAAQDGYGLTATQFVYPVAAPYSFWNSWHAPRLLGTPQAHWHQGTDILAPWWTPLYAVESGVLDRVGVNGLGGNRLWIDGESGTRYYYAHLVGYAPGMADGVRVKAGDIVGYVGDTGDSVGGPTHLHFEIHPVGTDDAVNPFPILSAIDAQRRPPGWDGAPIAA